MNFVVFLLRGRLGREKSETRCAPPAPERGRWRYFHAAFAMFSRGFMKKGRLCYDEARLVPAGNAAVISKFESAPPPHSCCMGATLLLFTPRLLE